MVELFTLTQYIFLQFVCVFLSTIKNIGFDFSIQNFKIIIRGLTTFDSDKYLMFVKIMQHQVTS